MAPLLLLLIALLTCLAAEPLRPVGPRVRQNPNPAVPLAAVIEFESPEFHGATVEASDGKHRWTMHYGREFSPAKGLPVAGMRPGRPHTLRLRLLDARGQAGPAATLRYTTPALPAGFDEFPPLKIKVHQPKRMEPGVTLFSPRRGGRTPEFGARYGMLVAVDDAGEVVWYYRTDSRISDLERRPNGNLLYVTQDFRIVEINVLGDVVREWYAGKRPQGAAKGQAIPVDTLTFHHEVDLMPNGNLIALGSEIREVDNFPTSEVDANAPRKRQRVMGDEVVEFDASGKVVWRWKAFDHLDPLRIGYQTFDGYWYRRGFPGVDDFSHANGVSYDAADDSVLINFRIQSAVVKVDRKSGQIKWVAGEPEGWPAHLRDRLFTLAPGGRWFYHQHCPQMTPQGTLLLFDNGNYGTRPYQPPVPRSKTYSRAVEFALDEKTRTLRELWSSESGGPGSVISTAMGDVQWLPKTGNILAHYGSLLPPADRTIDHWNKIHDRVNWSRIREYTRAQPAELVWEVEVGDPAVVEPVVWFLYGGDRIPGILP